MSHKHKDEFKLATEKPSWIKPCVKSSKPITTILALISLISFGLLFFLTESHLTYPDFINITSTKDQHPTKHTVLSSKKAHSNLLIEEERMSTTIKGTIYSTTLPSTKEKEKRHLFTDSTFLLPGDNFIITPINDQPLHISIADGDQIIPIYKEDQPKKNISIKAPAYFEQQQAGKIISILIQQEELIQSIPFTQTTLFPKLFLETHRLQKDQANKIFFRIENPSGQPEEIDLHATINNKTIPIETHPNGLKSIRIIPGKEDTYTLTILNKNNESILETVLAKEQGESPFHATMEDGRLNIHAQKRQTITVAFFQKDQLTHLFKHQSEEPNHTLSLPPETTSVLLENSNHQQQVISSHPNTLKPLKTLTKIYTLHPESKILSKTRFLNRFSWIANQILILLLLLLSIIIFGLTIKQLSHQRNLLLTSIWVFLMSLTVKLAPPIEILSITNQPKLLTLSFVALLMLSYIVMLRFAKADRNRSLEWMSHLHLISLIVFIYYQPTSELFRGLSITCLLCMCLSWTLITINLGFRKKPQFLAGSGLAISLPIYLLGIV